MRGEAEATVSLKAEKERTKELEKDLDVLSKVQSDESTASLGKLEEMAAREYPRHGRERAEIEQLEESLKLKQEQELVLHEEKVTKAFLVRQSDSKNLIEMRK